MKFSPVLILTLLIGCQNKSDLEGILTAKGVYWTVNIQKNGVFDYGNGKIEFNKDRHYRYYLNSDSTMKEMGAEIPGGSWTYKEGIKTLEIGLDWKFKVLKYSLDTVTMETTISKIKFQLLKKNK